MAGLTEPNQVAQREDLADIMSIVDVRATPFLSRVKKDKSPINTTYQWPVDKYDDHRVEGVVDGVDISEYENHAADRAVLASTVQKWWRSAKVSGMAEDLAVVAGVPSEIGQAKAKKTIELKRDIEATLLGGNDGQLDTGSVPYLTIGLDKWIDTTGPTVPASVPAAYRTRSGAVDTTATASLTETEVNAVLTAIFDATGMSGDYILLCGSVLRRRMTEMTRTASSTNANKPRNFVTDLDNKTITHSTTVYEGDYGNIEILTSQFIGGATVDTDRGYLLDMDKISYASHFKPRVRSFPDLGGGPRILVEACGGLKVSNPIGLGKFKP